MPRLSTLLLGLALPLFAAGSAAAHVSFETQEAVSEHGFKAVLQVPHGCDGKPTTEIQIKLPDGFVFAKPQPKPGWQIEIIKGDYKKSYDNHGKPITSGPLEIRWTGGELSDDEYDTFVIMGTFSGFAKETTVAFPVTQVCGADAQVAWDEVAAEGQSPHDLPHPAPAITVELGRSDHMDHAAAMDGMHDEPVKAGALEIEGGQIKAMLPGAKVGGGGFKVINTGTTRDTLLSVQSPAAGKVELHEMRMENDVMLMRKVVGGISIPSGQTIDFTDGKMHLMFMDVKTPFRKGESVPLTLTFEKAGLVEITLPVTEANSHQHN